MIRNLPLDQIIIPRGRRKPKDTEALVDSIREVGLLNPITVTKSFRLVAGGNRLAAHRILGRSEIPAQVLDLNDLDVELAEVDENLVRNELSVLERSEQLARRKEIYLARHPEAKRGGDRRSEGARSNRGDRRPKSFADGAAETTGISARTIHEEVQIAAKIGKDAKTLIRGTDLEDRKLELLSLARMPAAKQVAVVEAIVNGEARTVAQGKRAVERAEKRAAMACKAARAGGPADSWRIVEGDCCAEMDRMDAGSVRLVVCDPPYNLGVKYGEHCGDDMTPAAYLDWSRRWIGAAARLLTADGSLWLLNTPHWSARLLIIAEGLGLHLRQWITWYETFGENQARMFNLCSRALLWLVRDRRQFVFNDHAEGIRRPSDRQAKYRDKRADPGGKLWDDVWGVNPPIPRLVDNNPERLPDFPTQLPLSLVRPIVACASDPGDLVLDPFAGSATTGCACLESGRRFLGIELSGEFAERSRQRLLSHHPEESRRDPA
jgi:site-specific DNA-methyltransferase (adenine-specific)